MEKLSRYKNKYRTDSLRHKKWNYGNDGYYFITICTKNKKYFFGKIKDGRMVLNGLGETAQKYWKEIPEHFLFIKLDEFVIMPNHIHGILIIKKGLDCVNSSRPNSNVEMLQCNISTDEKNDYYRRISPKAGTLSSVVRSYKSVCTKNIKKHKADFA